MHSGCPLSLLLVEKWNLEFKLFITKLTEAVGSILTILRNSSLLTQARLLFHIQKAGLVSRGRIIHPVGTWITLLRDHLWLRLLPPHLHSHGWKVICLLWQESVPTAASPSEALLQPELPRCYSILEFFYIPGDGPPFFLSVNKPEPGLKVFLLRAISFVRCTPHLPLSPFSASWHSFSFASWKSSAVICGTL